ncbi:MAG TPA: hypothetical protein VMU55_02445 [Solirubrobacteraceae bacterium]|nr:hypothetical protein [Solirubrobacteraceae bacterium]
MDDVAQPAVSQQPHNRQTDDGLWHTVALRLSQTWDFVDRRDIDKHLVSLFIMLGTVKLTAWAMRFAGAPHPGMSGTDMAAIIASVTGPYMALQAAAIGFYFNSRR